ncbi:hypothetical protein RQP46_010344 [Phenoliferia psychrophenolica]
MRPRTNSHASSQQFIREDYPSAPSTPNATEVWEDSLTGSPSAIGTNFQQSATLESLYQTSTLDFDVERHGRYSVAPPPRASSSITSSSSSSLDKHKSPVASTYGLIPSTPALYKFEKSRWEDEADDRMHDAGRPNPRVGKARMIYETHNFRTGGGSGWGWAGVFDSAAVVLLVLGIVGVFADAPNISSRGVIDPDTPSSAYTKVGIDDSELELVFSDEFNTDGRTFYVGEDPFWEMNDLHYWQTADLEWYDPGQATTEGGYLAITLEKDTDANSHGLGYLGGMLLSWNKFCFTGGRVEVAVSLPGTPTISGYWPAVWIMGNLGKAGYGASLDGVWPYSYDACDIGTLPNQTDPTTGGPTAATTTGLVGVNYGEASCLMSFEYNEPHPGPAFANGTFPGRSSPEIDVFETTASATGGTASQSSQWGPFNPNYLIINASDTNVEYYSDNWDTVYNPYLGGEFQQSVSALSSTNASTYNSTTEFSIFGVDYTPTYLGGEGTGVINWINQDEVMWKLSDTAMGANAAAEISARPVTNEPMSIIANLGLSTSFTTISKDLVYPAVMRIDYIRVYQPKGKINIGCSPPLYPTADYIANNLAAYSNPNLTTYAQFRESVNEDTAFPKNRLTATC